MVSNKFIKLDKKIYIKDRIAITMCRLDKYAKEDIVECGTVMLCSLVPTSHGGVHWSTVKSGARPENYILANLVC